jgi:beta-phosphoglucomutase
MTLLFDLDGTLVDCEELHYQALNEALQLNNCDIITPEEHRTIYDGLPTNVKLEMLGVDNPEKINADKQRLTLDIVSKAIYPDEEVVNTIRSLSQEYTLFCVSNSKRRTIEEILKYAGLYDYFAQIISCEDVKDPKPAPDIYKYARKLADEPCIAFEDNLKGVLSADQAGIKCFHVIDSTHIRYEHITTLIRYV